MADLESLAARIEIYDVLVRYTRGVDRFDWDLVRSCYHPGAIDMHGSYQGDVEGFVAWASTALARFERTMHFLGNHYVELDGSHAKAETYCVAWHRRRTDDGLVDDVQAVRYLDHLSEREGAWKIDRRLVVSDWSREDVVAAETSTNPRRGCRGGEDLSYAAFTPGLELTSLLTPRES